MEDLALQPDSTKPTVIVGNKPGGFKNHTLIKSAARGIVLEALTAFKGGKVGKRGLLFQAMKELDLAMGSADKAERQWAVEHTLKLAMGMTKDDKANPLEELLKGSANVQINFNTHFSQRNGQAEALPLPPGPGDQAGLE